MSRRFMVAVASAIAVLSGCASLDVADPATTAPSTTAPAFVGPTTLPGSATSTTTTSTTTSTTTTTTMVESSFAALRKECQTSEDRKVVDSLVIALKGAVPTTQIEDVKKELKKFLKKEGNLLTFSIGRATEDSCLHELQKFLPEFTPSNGGGNSGHGGSGGGNGNGGGNVGNGGGGPGTPVDHNCPSGQIWDGTKCGTATPVVVPPVGSTPSSTSTSTTTTTTPSGGGGSTSSTSSTTTTVPAVVCPIFGPDGNLIPECA